MTLTTRLLLFFLAALAFVLAGFSSAVYMVTRHHLYHQSEKRLEATLNTLAAAVEVNPDGLEWEPTERGLRFAFGQPEEEIVWLVRDESGETVDQAAPAEAADFLREGAAKMDAGLRAKQEFDLHGDRWQFHQRRLQSETSRAAPGATGDASERKYAAMSITVGSSLAPVQAALRKLAVLLTGLSIAIWLSAWFVGWFLCRRALRPVREMALAARAMDATDLDQRLSSVATGDELEDFSRAFNDLLDRLQQAFERQRRFTGDASHQLRTPLAAMLGQIEVALRRPRPSEEYERVLTSVHQQADRLRRIVEALLFLARADADVEVPHREPVELGAWLAEHLQPWTEHTRGPDIVLECTEDLSADVQPVLFGELINILIENACKYSKSGTKVTIRLTSKAEFVELSIQDEGCGITTEELPHLYEPFFRTAEARRLGIEGLGLGLTVAKRLASALGATLTVTSQIGRGSCFIVSLARTLERQTLCA